MTEAIRKSARSRVRGERLETRVTAEQKNLIERAAALQGRTVTDFLLDHHARVKRITLGRVID